MNYYSENDPKMAAWLGNLIEAGFLPPGHVDARNIAEVTPSDLRGYTQCHFFAGAGGWPLAFELNHMVPILLAGWSTPTTMDAQRGVQPPRPHDTGVPLSQQVAGLTAPGSGAATVNIGGSQLNPNFSRWLMGFPPEPKYVGGVTRSSHKPSRSS